MKTEGQAYKKAKWIIDLCMSKTVCKNCPFWGAKNPFDCMVQHPHSWNIDAIKMQMIDGKQRG